MLGVLLYQPVSRATQRHHPLQTIESLQSGVFLQVPLPHSNFFQLYQKYVTELISIHEKL